ncbi:MAG: hypothetical protein ACOZCO_05250 [Bacteroidota bacterium]
MPENLQKGHEFLVKATNNGASWEAYKSEKIREVIETYLQKLSEHTREKKAAPIKESKVKKEAAAKERKAYELEKKVIEASGKKQVEHFPEEFKFIRRFVNMNGKTKTAEQIWNFLTSLQRSITEKRMSKTSPYKKEIDFIQDSLIRNYNAMKGKMKVSLQEKTVLDFKKILGEEMIYPSVQFIKKFIRLHGKVGVKEKAKKLLESMNRAMKRGVFTNDDKYFSHLNDLHKRLEKFVKTPGMKSLSIETAELNGLKGILGECGCMHDVKKAEDLSGIEYGGRSAKIMNSMDFATLRFNTIGFKDKWKDFIGDPTPGFSMMVYAKPKMGKSYLCVDFAGYLARNHGKVLYVAREEGLDYTLQQKLNDKAVKHPNLFVSSYLPEDLAEYDFIILDSVNKLGLSPKDLEILRRKNPGKSFVFVFQTTKEGVFRGNNEFQHDVDVVVDIPEKGKAVQFGRFNQGGEMNIFSN